MTGKKVGIEDMAAYAPRHYLDMREFERRRGIREGHVTDIIGINQMAVLDAHEDAVTMGSNALLRVMRRNGTRPRDLDSIYVGTESVDNKSQSVALRVKSNLGQVFGENPMMHVGAIDFVQACIGGTYAVENSCAWVSKGHSAAANGGNSAWSRFRGMVERLLEIARLRAASDHTGDNVVGAIAVDYARYPFLGVEEQTQGAVAVAMLIKKGARLLAFEPGVGKASGYGWGWHKPLDTEYPVNNPDRSIAEYLHGMKMAYLQWVPAFLKGSHIRLRPGEAPTDYIDYAAFHQPNAKMVSDAVAYLFMHEWRDLPRWQQIEASLGTLPPRRDYTIEELMGKEYKEYRRKFTATPQFQRAYNVKVLPTTLAGRRIGNGYAGSVWADMAGFAETEGRKTDLTGRRFAYASYGSSWSAAIGTGIFQEGYREVANGMDFFPMLDSRIGLSFEEYERLHEYKRGEGASLRPPEGGEFGISGVRKGKEGYGHRDYRFYE